MLDTKELIVERSTKEMERDGINVVYVVNSLILIVC
jgi:hypothetical protein